MPDASPFPGPALAERLRGRAAAVLDRTPAAFRRRLAGGEPVVIDGQTFDPTLQAVLALDPRGDRGRMIREDPVGARALLRREALAVQLNPTPVAGVRDLTIDGADDSLDARLYTPPGGGRPPLLVYFHGGGFVSGDLDTHDEPCRLLCREAGHVVLSVAYRRAPEHPFPAAHDDALAAFRWAQDHALHLGADPTHVTVGGDSAGANLATATAQATRDDRPPAAQLVIYPTVDTPTDRPSRSLFDGFFLADSERSGYFEVYTRRTDAPADDPRLSPIYGPLDGLAPALVVVAGFDVLRDESEAYAEALRAAGSRVLMQREPSLPHGFVNMTGVSRTARRATAEMAHRWHEVVATVR